MTVETHPDPGAGVTDFEFGISAIDSRHIRLGLDAIHLMHEKGRAAIIDTGTNHSVPYILRALEYKQIPREAVDFVILTHVHLDHAGGAGLLMRHLPNARLFVHPRGARHMLDPSRLMASTQDVYGDVAARRMYGDIVPVDEARLTTVGEGALLSLAGRELEFFDTPGHARHHVCILDRRTRHLFTGDMFGLSYRELDNEGREFVFPATTPTQFDPRAFHASIGRLLALEPRALYLTHYSKVTDVNRLATDLLRLVDRHVDVAMSAAHLDDADERQAALETGVRDLVLAEGRAQGWALQAQSLAEFMALDIRFNAQGLASWLAVTRA
jgi:glyoxylase-like metal-dependent hydrolase (beta-lactamase superfamily II)